MVIAGFDIPCLNVPYTHVSEAGNIMTQGEPFAVCYFDYAEGRQFSLRSTDEGEDVSIIAKHFGGGGHRNASAFRIPFEKYDEFHEIQGDSI
jgi:oligoribonuclease NrnB/cAMP/cGMP phosphodiesterase (DHH superfamily)